MCGIAYKHNFGGLPVNDSIFDQYVAQRSRGTEGFGLFDGQFMNMVRSAKEEKITKWLAKYPSNLIMFHHRFPTSTVNVAKAAHPLSSYDYFGDTQYVMVHNGIIRNPDEVFVAHQELGIEYRTMLPDLTFNDSESLMWDFALTMEGKQEKMTVYGDMAFICLKIVNGALEKMYFGRQGRPLNLKRTDDSIELSSEGVGDEIDEDKLYTWHYGSKRLTSKEMKFQRFKPYSGTTYGGNEYSGNNYFPYTNDQANYRTYDDWYTATHGYSQYDDGDNDGFDVLDVEDDKETTWKKLRAKYNKETLQPKKIGAIIGETYPIEFMNDKPDHYIYLDDSDIIDKDDAQANRKLYAATGSEVQDLAMQYMIAADGVFEQAYQMLEDELFEIVESAETVENFRRQLLIEDALQFIEADPEYTNSFSVSSIWSALWQQQLLKA